MTPRQRLFQWMTASRGVAVLDPTQTLYRVVLRHHGRVAEGRGITEDRAITAALDAWEKGG